MAEQISAADGLVSSLPGGGHSTQHHWSDGGMLRVAHSPAGHPTHVIHMYPGSGGDRTFFAYPSGMRPDQAYIGTPESGTSEYVQPPSEQLKTMIAAHHDHRFWPALPDKLVEEYPQLTEAAANQFLSGHASNR